VLGRLSPDGNNIMLVAFTRDGPAAAARTSGADVVRRYQQRLCRFRCECQDTVEPMPVLVPGSRRSSAAIRTTPTTPMPAQFEMDPVEREENAKLAREQEPRCGFQLARAVANPDAVPVRDDGDGKDTVVLDGKTVQRAAQGVGKAHERTRLLQLLCKLLFDAQLQDVGAGSRWHGDQVQAMCNAASGISLGGALRLTDVLDINPELLDDVAGLIKRRTHWPAARRPHGVLVLIAKRIEGNVLFATSGARFTDEGPIGVFGPGQGRVRHGPFVVAVLVASPVGRAPLVALEAYAHSCWSATDPLALDSPHERRSLDILVRFAGWMAKQGYRIGITKPFYDRSQYYLGREDTDVVVKSDTEGTVFNAKGRFIRTFVVETVGSAMSSTRPSRCGCGRRSGPSQLDTWSTGRTIGSRRIATTGITARIY